jgi:hypothetical protein
MRLVIARTTFVRSITARARRAHPRLTNGFGVGMIRRLQPTRPLRETPVTAYRLQLSESMRALEAAPSRAPAIS